MNGQMWVLNGAIVTKEQVEFIVQNNPFHNYKNSVYSDTIMNIHSAML